MLRAFGYALYCGVLRQVEYCWLKFEKGQIFMQHLRMLHDIVVIWPGPYNNVAHRHAHLFDFKYLIQQQ